MLLRRGLALVVLFGMLIPAGALPVGGSAPPIGPNSPSDPRVSVAPQPEPERTCYRGGDRRDTAPRGRRGAAGAFQAVDPDAITEVSTQGGPLDTTLDHDGKLLHNMGSLFPADSSAYAVAVLSTSGDILVAGEVWVDTGYHFALANFYGGGTYSEPFDPVSDFVPSSTESAYAIAMEDRSGHVVSAGEAWVNGSYQFALTRHVWPNYRLDDTFDGDGKVLTDFGSSTWDSVGAVTIDASDRIVVAGEAYVNGGYQFALARYLLSGALDTSFDGDGKVLTNFGSSSGESAYDAAIDGEGRIVAAGEAYVNGTYSMALARYIGLAPPQPPPPPRHLRYLPTLPVQ